MGLKMNNVNIMGVHQCLGEGGEGHKKYIWGIAYKVGLDNLQGGLAKSRESAFEGGWYHDAHSDFILVNAGT